MISNNQELNEWWDKFGSEELKKELEEKAQKDASKFNDPDLRETMNNWLLCAHGEMKRHKELFQKLGLQRRKEGF